MTAALSAGSTQISPQMFETNVENHERSCKPQCSKKTQRITKIAGQAFTATGLGGSALFFGAPITIPLGVSVAAFFVLWGLGSCGSPANSSDSAATNKCWEAIIAGIGGGIGLGAWAGYEAWYPAINFVYDDRVATIAGISAVASTALGVALWATACRTQIKSEAIHV